MNIEFHYYIIHILCKEAGLSDIDSEIIAYSSQYVDDNIVTNIIDFGNEKYETQVTQNYGWWGEYFPKHVYIPFHFFPGDIDYPKAKRLNEKTNKYNCTPGSKNVTRIVEEAFKSDNLYQIGIALHTYADSWAHQNFSGLNEAWNIVYRDTILPNVGHAEVYSKPDRIKNVWTDERLISENQRIVNRDRFIEAAENIYKMLCKYTGKNGNDVELVISKIQKMIGDEEDKREIRERIYDYILSEDLMEYNKFEWIKDAVYYNPSNFFLPSEMEDYNKLIWIKDALLYKTSLVKKPILRPKENFYNSNWYLWNEAIKTHLKNAKIILNGMI